MAAPIFARIEQPILGLDTDSAPEAVDLRRAPALENLLVDKPGKLVIRGPINESTAVTAAGSGLKPVGVWAFNNKLLFGYRALKAGASRDPWVAPYRKAFAATDLSNGSTQAYHVDLDTGVVTSVTVAANTVPGHSSARLGAFVYGVGFDSAAAATSVNGGWQKPRALLRWDGSAIAPTAYTNGPTMSQAAKTFASRLFVAGGIAPGGGSYQPNALYWSDPGGPTTDTLAVWQDDTSGLVNQILVDDDQGDFIVALAKVGNALAIFKRRSIHMLTGSGSSTFSVNQFSNEAGCIDPRSVVEYEAGVFFMSDAGYMFFDGAQLTNVTPTIRSSLLTSALRNVGDAGLDGGFVTASRLPNSYVGLCCGVSPASTAHSTTDFAGLCYVPSRAWATFSSDVLVGSKPIAFGRAQSKTFLLDDEKVLQANKVVVPELELPQYRGYDVADAVFTFDASGTGPLFNGTGGTLKNQLTGIEAFASISQTAAIRPKWYSRLHQLSSPLRVSLIHRVLISYAFKVASTVDDALTGWTARFVNGRGDLLTTVQAPSEGDPTTQYPYRREFGTEIFQESRSADAQVQITWEGATAGLPQAELYSVVIEYSVESQPRSNT